MAFPWKINYWEREGQTVRFFLGYIGDGIDWDLYPYEAWAQKIDDIFVQKIVRVRFHPSVMLLEPKDWNRNIESPFSMNDIVRRKVPCLLVYPKQLLYPPSGRANKDLWMNYEYPMLGMVNKIEHVSIHKFYIGDHFKAHPKKYIAESVYEKW